MATFLWTGWQKSSGLGGNIPMDYVATFPWTGWQKSVEYAVERIPHTSRMTIASVRDRHIAVSQRKVLQCFARMHIADRHLQKLSRDQVQADVEAIVRPCGAWGLHRRGV